MKGRTKLRKKNKIILGLALVLCLNNPTMAISMGRHSSSSHHVVRSSAPHSNTSITKSNSSISSHSSPVTPTPSPAHTILHVHEAAPASSSIMPMITGALGGYVIADALNKNSENKEEKKDEREEKSEAR